MQHDIDAHAVSHASYDIIDSFLNWSEHIKSKCSGAVDIKLYGSDSYSNNDAYGVYLEHFFLYVVQHET